LHCTSPLSGKADIPQTIVTLNALVGRNKLPRLQYRGESLVATPAEVSDLKTIKNLQWLTHVGTAIEAANP